MKNLVLLFSLFFTCEVFGQNIRLDSLVHYSTQFNFENYINTYSYTSDRDYIIFQKRLNNDLGADTWTTFYRDSLPIESIGEFNSGGEIINEYQYDDLRRETYSSSGSATAPRIKRKSYWKDTNLTTMEEEIFLVNKDTVTYHLKHYSYDDLNRMVTSDTRFLDELGKEHRSNSVTDYAGDSLVMEEMNIYNEGKGWANSVLNTLYFPKTFYGDTICTKYCQWDIDTQTKESNCSTKYEWGKPGTPSDWGYIAYRKGNIYGKIMDFTSTENGYVGSTYECRLEKGPDNWREDLKTRFKLMSTSCVTLNEYELPKIAEEYDALTGNLNSRFEYYYKETHSIDNSLSSLTKPSTCQIIHQLNPALHYYDYSGKAVIAPLNFQLLIQSGPQGISSVLFIYK